MAKPGGRWVRALAGAVRAQPVAGDRLVVAATILTVVATVWFAVGPDSWQTLGIRAVTPALTGMTAVGQWYIGADRRLSAEASRFWLVLSLALFIFTAGMIVDLLGYVLVELGYTGAEEVHVVQSDNTGETLLYPVAGLLAVLALIIFPTAVRHRMDRIKIGLDVGIVLFGGATFVWYFLASRRLDEVGGWVDVADGLVLPALILLAGFAILRITMTGANLITRSTMVCFVFAAVATAASIFLDVEGHTFAGRIGSTLQALALGACVLGVAIQRRSPPRTQPATRTQPGPARVGLRRPFTVLPYGALGATVGLLVWVIAPGLDYRGWVVAVGVLALCVAVMARQLASLWENSRLLDANEELTERLRHQAYHDDLTGLANRALFAERVDRALGRALGTTVAVLFVDLDDFKIVNDSLGHNVGDELLTAVAERLRGAVGADDLLSRLGGDEFAVLVENTTEGAAVALAERVVTALADPLRLEGLPVRVTASVGIAIGAGGRSNSVDLLRNADVAMYAAKSTGEGGWRIFEPALLTGLLERHRRRAAFVRAVGRDEIEVRYRPIVDLADGTAHAVEAVPTWRDRGEAWSPEELVSLAEETGLLAEIDQRVLLRACQDAVRWETAPVLHARLSARNLRRSDLVVDVDEALRRSGLPPDRLTLHIVEGATAPPRREVVAGSLDALARLGVGLGVAGFGAGHTSFADLRLLPVSTVKIDKVFVGGPATLTAAVIGLATTLGLGTIADGVEDAEQARRLVELGCRYGQGPRYGEPLSADGMAHLLDQTASRVPWPR